jgi:hypothetical protein
VRAIVLRGRHGRPHSRSPRRAPSRSLRLAAPPTSTEQPATQVRSIAAPARAVHAPFMAIDTTRQPPGTAGSARHHGPFTAVPTTDASLPQCANVADDLLAGASTATSGRRPLGRRTRARTASPDAPDQDDTEPSAARRASLLLCAKGGSSERMAEVELHTEEQPSLAGSASPTRTCAVRRTYFPCS